jgi:DNA-binding NarL/FixJ family response regulator
VANVPTADGGPSGVSVVLVEDHRVLRRETADLLRASGVRVLAVTGSIRDGFAAVTALQPDVAVVGSHLPDGRGVDLCRALRPVAPRVAVLVHAGTLTRLEEREALEAGAAAVILKAIRGAALLKAVTSYGRASTQ